MKFCDHASVCAIENVFNPQSSSFSKISVDDVLKKINKLGNRNAIQNIGMPIEIL